MSGPRMNAYYTAFFTIIVTRFVDGHDDITMDLIFFLVGTTVMLFLIFLGNDRLKGFNKWHARGIMLVHYSIMLCVFLFISFIVKPLFDPLPDTKLTTILGFVVSGIIFIITSKIIVKLSSIISDGVFPKGMPNWESNVEDQCREHFDSR